MPRPRDAERHGPAWMVQAASIARAFHLEGRSKIEIAQATGLSRFKVARILEEARDLGLVRITVEVPVGIDADLSAQLQEAYGLRRAIVVECASDSPSGTRECLGRAAADLLAEVVADDDVLGLSCSRTVAVATHALSTLARCRVVQLTGTLAGPEVDAGSVESVRRAASVGGGKAFPIYAPMVLPDVSTRTALARELSIRQALEQFHEVTVAMIAIGGWEPELSTMWRTVDAEERAAISAAGTVGEIAARPFDRAGRPVRTPIDDRVLGMTLDQLRRIPEVIGIAADHRRASAVRSALLGRLVKTLVCDDQLARALLETVDEEVVVA